MHALITPNAWHTDQIIDDLAEHGFSIIDEVYPLEDTNKIRQECLHHLHQFRQAEIQNGVMNDIRRDHILWIDSQLPVSQAHLHTLKNLSGQLNRAFFFGLNEVEAHFACYNTGEFYALHRDNPHGKNGRVISTVYYLHEKWQDDWGGQLHLKDKNDVWQTIEPKPNRMALFQSDLLHEVLESKQQRLSITAWLRNDQNVFA